MNSTSLKPKQSAQRKNVKKQLRFNKAKTALVNLYKEALSGKVTVATRRSAQSAVLKSFSEDKLPPSEATLVPDIVEKIGVKEEVEKLISTLQHFRDDEKLNKMKLYLDETTQTVVDDYFADPRDVELKEEMGEIIGVLDELGFENV